MGIEVHETILGYDLTTTDGRPLAVARVREHLPRTDSPKPCFAPIYTTAGDLVTEYRPADHTWHTGLYYGWVYANKANLWGGPWYLPETDKYEYVDDTHGIQRHDGFEQIDAVDGGVSVREALTWLDAGDQPMASERRAWDFELCDGGWRWRIETVIEPVGGPLTLGSSRKSHYSGLELRMGPPFAGHDAEAVHRDSEGRDGHAETMLQRARWCRASGAGGGMVALLDHPDNPRHPVQWFTRANLLGAGLLMSEDLTIAEGERLRLRYRLLVLDEPVADARIEAEFGELAADSAEAV